METLRQEFNKYGAGFTQLERTGNVALFQRKNPETGAFLGYEVVIVQVRKEGLLGGKVIPARECLPSSSQWGSRGWSYLSEEKARAKFTELVRSRGHGKPLRKRR